MVKKDFKITVHYVYDIKLVLVWIKLICEINQESNFLEMLLG